MRSDAGFFDVDERLADNLERVKALVDSRCSDLHLKRPFRVARPFEGRPPCIRSCAHVQGPDRSGNASRRTNAAKDRLSFMGFVGAEFREALGERRCRWIVPGGSTRHSGPRGSWR
jgi:hypothetical protein